jgi:hypothetical protein
MAEQLSLMVATLGHAARRTAQRTLMELGGRLGFEWRFSRMCSARIFVIFDAQERDAPEIVATIHQALANSRAYLVGEWGCRFTDADVQLMCGWLDGVVPERKV